MFVKVFFSFLTFQEVPDQEDHCAFQEPLGRLVKGDMHVDIFHFYHTMDNHIKEPSERDMKTYDTSDFFPLKPCMFLGMSAFCPNKPLKVLKLYFRSDNLEPSYTCKDGKWQKNKGQPFRNGRASAALQIVLFLTAILTST